MGRQRGTPHLIRRGAAGRGRRSAPLSLHVALIEPQIPPNTGNVARLCAAADVPLHLIGPLGFQLDDPAMRRAGLDYWDAVDLWVHPGWRAFRTAIARERCLYFSSHGDRSFWDAPFAAGCCLIFGNETTGMPERIREKYPERIYRIPMSPAVRSLNLATAVAIVLYEAIRQLRGRLSTALDARTPNQKGRED